MIGRSVLGVDPRIAEAKRAMREEVGARVRALPPDDRAVWSDRIAGAIGETLAFERSGVVAGFWPLADEPDVRGLLHRALALGKRVCLPRVAGTGVEWVEVDDLAFAGSRSGLGIWEPSGGRVIAPAGLELVVAPGVAFDARGGRLGRGKGFFDRVLGGRPGAGGGWMVCGVCFGVAMVDSVPAEGHDARVDAVATEAGVFAVSSESAGLWATGRTGR